MPASKAFVRLAFLSAGAALVAACLGRPRDSAVVPPATASVPNSPPRASGAAVSNLERPFEARARDLVARMTLDEKISQLGTNAPAIPRLGIPAYQWWNEALHGVTWKHAVTVFPQAIGLAATWDPELLHKVGTAISTEVRALYNQGQFGLTLFTPVINIARDPRWGRTQEGYGEDPFLVGRLATEYIKGIQGDDPMYLRAIATPKHFALNNTEKARHRGTSDAPVDEIMDYYLPHFRAAVIDGGAFSVMCAYNRVNGVPACANDWLLEQVLRKDWGFKGFVVTDCDAINDMVWGHKFRPNAEEASAAALAAGTDLNCGDSYQKHLKGAIDRGLVKENDIDRALARLLVARLRLGMFDPPERVPYSGISAAAIDSPEHRAIAAQAAAESLVLLRNDGTLPLDASKLKTLAVIGPAASVMLRGSSGYHGFPSEEVTIVQGLERLAAGRFAVVYEPGAMLANGEGAPMSAIPKTALSTRDSGKTVAGLTGEYFANRDFKDRVLARTDPTIAMDWGNASPAPAIPSDNFSVRWTGKLTAPTTGRYVLRLSSDDGARLEIDGKRVIDVWGDHSLESRSAILDLVAGKPHDLELEYYEHQGFARVSLEWGTIADGTARAVRAAQRADRVVFVAGVDETASDEEHDFDDLELPKDQRALLEAVFHANPKTIVILQSGNPIILHDALTRVPALLEAWYPGQATGTAVADAIFGVNNPSGKLPLTFYTSLAQLPPMDDYDFRHGRTYQYLKDPPTFPFGHGLSYSSFAYSDLRITPERVSDSATLHVDFDLRNASGPSGVETAELYVADKAASAGRPRERLVAFRRVSVDAGASTHVRIDVPIAEIAHWDVPAKRFVVTPGQYELRVGSSSSDIRQRATFEVNR